MPIRFDDIESMVTGVNSGNYATSGTPNSISTSSGGIRFDDIEELITGKKLQSQQQIQQIPQQQQQAYAGPIQSGSSPVSTMQRAGISTANTQEGRMNILKAMGFEVLTDPKGELLVKQGDKVFPVNEKGFTLGDLADYAGSQIPALASMVGMGAGVLTTAPTFGIANPVTMGAAAAGTADFIRQKIAQSIGSGESTSKKDIGIQAAVAGGTALIPFGKIVQSIFPKAITEKVIKSIIGEEIATNITRAVENKFAQVSAKEGSEVASNVAKSYSKDLITSELNKHVAGRAIINSAAGGIVGGAASGVETALSGGSPTDVLKSTAFGAGTGLVTGPLIGEAFHQAGGGLTKVKNMVVPKTESVNDMVYRKFVGKNPTIKEIKAYVDKLNVSAIEKQPIYEYLSKEQARLTPEYKPLVLPNEPISFNNIVDRLKESGYTYNKAIDIITKMSDSVPTTVDSKKTPAILFKDPVAVVEWLNTNLPKPRAPRTKNEVPVVEPVVEPVKMSSKLRSNLTELFGEKNTKLLEASTSPKDVAFKELEAALAKKSEKATGKNLAKLSETMGLLAQFKSSMTPVTSKTSLINIEPKQNLVTGGNKPSPITAKMPIEEPILPRVSLERPLPSLKVENMVNELYKNNITETYERPLLSRAIDYIEGKADPVSSPSKLFRMARRNSASVKRIMDSKVFGDSMDKPIDFIEKIVKYSDQFKSSAKGQAARVSKYIKDSIKKGDITKERFNQLWEDVINNGHDVAEAEGRSRIYTKDEMLAKAQTPTEKTILEGIFKVTEGMSDAMQGRSYIDEDGNILYEAGKPSIFAPKISNKPPSKLDTSVRVEELTKSKMADNPNITESEARASAEAAVKTQSEHASPLKPGHARVAGRETLQQLKARNVETDFDRVMDAYVNKVSKAASLMKSAKETGKSTITPEDLLNGDTGIETAINRKLTELQGEINANIEQSIAKFKVENPKSNISDSDVLAYQNAIKNYTEWLLKGVKPNEFINGLMKLNSLKLTTSGISNFYQPMLTLLEVDFPTWAGAIRDRLGTSAMGKKLGVDNLPRIKEWQKAYESKGFKDLVDSTEQAGTKLSTYTENMELGTGGKMLSKAADIAGKSLKWTEGPNRLFASDAGFKTLYKAEKTLNDPMASTHERLSAASDASKLLDRDIDIRGKNEFSTEDYKTAMYNMTKNTQFGYDPFLLPHWVTGPKLRALAQFKTFVYNASRLNYESAIGELRKGNFDRAVRNLFIMGIILPMPGKFIQAIKHGVLGTETPEDETAIKGYFNDLSEVTGGGFVDQVTEANSGSQFVASLTGPIGGTLGQAFDAVKDPSLESMLKFMTQQIGGAGTFLRNQLGIGKK